MIYRFIHSLSSGISILKVSLSPIRTVSTSLALESKIRILGGGASGADVMLIISGSLLKFNAKFQSDAVSKQRYLIIIHSSNSKLKNTHTAFDTLYLIRNILQLIINNEMLY